MKVLPTLLGGAAVLAGGALLVLTSCGSSRDGYDDPAGGPGTPGPSFGGPNDDAGSDGNGCSPPDMLVVLDRTLSMAATPKGAEPPNTPAGHALSKWTLATSAVKRITAPPFDQTIRFGLELFPMDPISIDAGPAAGHCVTLSQQLGGNSATNTKCQVGELAVYPSVGTGVQIAARLDPETSHLCVTTPIGLALDTARMIMSGIVTQGRNQFVLLVTDGGETCANTSLAITQDLAAKGVETFVVGFGAKGGDGVNEELLNDLACAGKRAKDFATACVPATAGTGYVAKARTGPALFNMAEDGAALEATLQTIATSVCCGCPK